MTIHLASQLEDVKGHNCHKPVTTSPVYGLFDNYYTLF